jgi:hypothetical protein
MAIHRDKLKKLREQNSGKEMEEERIQIKE